jgi:stress-induced morphogen
MSKKIRIEVDENGEIKIETLGFKGKSCLKESKWIKDLLGSEISSQLTPAYFMTEESKEVRKKFLPICG